MDSNQILAFSAIFISLVSLATSIFFSVAAHKHARKTVLPFPYLERADFEDEIRVRLHNKGTGPLILLGAVTTCAHEEGHLIELVPKDVSASFVFSAFSRITERRALRPGEHLDLLVAQIDPHDPEHVRDASSLRRFLMDCSVAIQYTDVYETGFEKYVTDLEWFGRRFRD